MRAIILAFLIFTSCSNKGGLEEQQETLELQYIAWACDCANWATKEDLEKYADNVDNQLANRCIFIEPAHELLTLPNTLGYSSDIIKFTGQFYKNIGFPKNYKSSQYPDKARVFRYTEYEVVKSNYHNYKNL